MTGPTVTTAAPAGRTNRDASGRTPAPRHAPEGAPPPAAPRGTRDRRIRPRLAVVAVVLAAAFGTLLAFGLGSSLNYFDTVDQALANKAALGARTFRLEGVVVPGSIERLGSDVAFTVAGSRGHRIAVVNHGSPPQLFQPDVPVVVVGHFTGASFVSDQVIVDHNAQYVQQHPNRVRSPNGTVR